MIRKDLPKCPFCGAYARSWEWNGGARIDCSAWGGGGNEHYVGVGGKTLDEAEKNWNKRYAESEDVEKLCMKHYKQGRLDERTEREGRLMQAYNPD